MNHECPFFQFRHASPEISSFVNNDLLLIFTSPCLPRTGYKVDHYVVPPMLNLNMHTHIRATLTLRKPWSVLPCCPGTLLHLLSFLLGTRTQGHVSTESVLLYKITRFLPLLLKPTAHFHMYTVTGLRYSLTKAFSASTTVPYGPLLKIRHPTRLQLSRGSVYDVHT